jgi:hypothetical protein
VQEQTLHETLAKMGIWIPVEKCRETLKALDKRFSQYKPNVMYYTWKWIKERSPYYIVNHQGRRFVAAVSPEFEGYKNYTDFIHSACKARTAFFELCRKTASFLVQGSGTGDQCQCDGVYIIDLLDKLTKKEWSWNRFENGNWNLVAPLYLKYDELCVEAHNDFIAPVTKIFETEPGKYKYMDSYLNRPHLKGLELGTDVTIEKQWSTTLPKNYLEMTEERNEKYYYSGTIRFRA